MDNNDLLYVAYFYFSIAASIIDKCYVTDKHKGKYGAAVGFLALLYLCGFEAVYPMVNILVNTAIICFSTKRSSGTLAFSFTCCYLFFFRYCCSASSITNVIMMSSTLRMIGIAFDASDEANMPEKKADGNPLSYRITPENIICYALHHVGLIGVPYYTYKTYCEYLILPFKHLSTEWLLNCVIAIVDSHIIMLGRYLLNKEYSIEYLSTEEFYDKRSLLFRLWYIYPLGLDFILRIGNAFVLTNASCHVTGIGLYPEFTKPKCGHGPTEKIENMLEISRDSLSQYHYSHETVQNADVEKMHTTIQFKESIKYWNQTIQFWLYKYVYKRIPYKMLRKPATMLFSSFWHGLQIGYFSSLFFSSFIIYMEERWEEIFKGRRLSSMEANIWLILKLHVLYNLTFNFVCKDWSLFVRYQTSVYWNYIIILLLSLIGSMLFARRRK